MAVWRRAQSDWPRQARGSGRGHGAARCPRPPSAAPLPWARPWSSRPRHVVAQLLGEPRPAAGVVVRVPGLLGIRPVDPFETAFDDAQPGASALGGEGEFDEHRVVLACRRAFWMDPAKRKAVGRFHHFHLNEVLDAALELQPALAADS